MSDIERHIIKPRCSVCHGIVYSDQGYHGVSMDHYDCHTSGKRYFDDHMAQVKAAMDAGDRAMGALMGEVGLKPRKPRARAGEGALAQHVKKLVLEAIQEKFGCGIRSANLWLQEGDYRGPKWDLDSWGVNAVLDDGHNLMVSCSSLAPMGDYRRCKAVHLGHDIKDYGLCYDISVPGSMREDI